MTKPAKSAQIPKLGSAGRRALLDIITELPIYKEYLKKGRRFFTKSRLDEIESTYPNGLSWEEINRFVTQEGLSLTQPAFRKYLQDGLIPKAVRYNSTSKGRIAIYDASIISHLNLVLFIFSVPSNALLNEVINILNMNEITATEAIESRLNSPLYAEIIKDIYQGNCHVELAMSEVLAKYPDVLEKAAEMFSEIEEIFNLQIATRTQALVDFLNDCSMQLSDIPSEK